MGLYNNSSTIGIGPKATAIAMAVTRLYHADSEGKFHTMKLGGILCLVADRKLHSKFLRLYDINTSDLLFQTELYINFNEKYRELNDYFYSFPLEKVNVGIQFANVHDASVFKNLIQTYSFKGESTQDTVKNHKNKLGNHSLDITRPLAFERKEHAGWDPNSQTFVLNEVPKEIKMLLKKAGFKKKDLKKKETALAIYEVLLRGIEFDNTKSQIKIGGRTSSNMNSKDFLSNRHSNEDSRMINDRTYSNMNYAMNHLSTQSNMGVFGNNILSQDLLDPKHKQTLLMNNLGNHVLNTARGSSNARDKSLNLSPDQNGNQKEEQKIMRPPPIPPPLMGMIPPPPMGQVPANVGFHIPPPGGFKMQPPPITTTNGGVQNQVLSFNEQLVMQSQNLKKVQEKEINTKVKNMSESQQMKIAQNLAAVLEKRREIMQGVTSNKKDDSDEESDSDDVNSDDSTW